MPFALVLAVAGIMATDSAAQRAVVPLRPPPMAAVQTEPADDPWFGEDKFKHFAMSFAITAFAYSGARAVFDREPSLALAVTGGAAAGLLKELRDRSTGRPFSLRDLAWDAAGVALGYLVISQTN